MEGVVKQEWGSLLVHLDNFTFFRINTHQPLVFLTPQGYSNNGLQLEIVILRVDCQVQDSIICKQVDDGLNILRKVVKVHEE